MSGRILNKKTPSDSAYQKTPTVEVLSSYLKKNVQFVFCILTKVASLRKFAWFLKMREYPFKRHIMINENHTVRFSVSEKPTLDVSS